MAQVLQPQGSSNRPQQAWTADSSGAGVRSYDQLERIVASLEARRNVHISQPCLVLPALHALRSKIQALASQPSTSAEGSQTSSRRIDELSTRVERLIQQVTIQAQSDQSNSLNDREATTTHFQLSSSSMSRYLHDSIKRSRNKQAQDVITLPPTPRLVLVDAADEVEEERLDDLGRGKATSQREAEDDELDEYGGSSRLRKRVGFKGIDGEDAPDHSTSGGFVDENRKTENNDAYPPPPSVSTAPLVSADRTTHEALSSELLRMASILKNQTISFSSALERDRKLLESTDTQLSSNLSLMTQTRGRLGQYAHKARGMGWFTLATVIMVVVTWMLMFVIIRLT